jgi:hypothetical protein
VVSRLPEKEVDRSYSKMHPFPKGARAGNRTRALSPARTSLELLPTLHIGGDLQRRRSWPVRDRQRPDWRLAIGEAVRVAATSGASDQPFLFSDGSSAYLSCLAAVEGCRLAPVTPPRHRPSGCPLR